MSAAFALALTACEAIAPLTGGGPGEAAPGSALLAAPQSARDAAAAFLDAWGRRDYDAMYGLLSPEAQQLTTLPVFRATYEAADTAIGTSGVRHTVHEVTDQGRTAVVRYDLVIESGIFGEIPDNGRTMRLLQGAGGYRVAWSNMDIFDGYAAGTTLTALTRRQPRGDIYDRAGLPLVEQDSVVIDLFIMRDEIPDVEACYTLLGTVLRRQRGDIIAYFERFATNTIFGFGEIGEDEFNRWSAQLSETCAIRTDSHVTRRYAGHGAAAHITGYIGQQTASEQTQFAAQGYGPGDLIGKTAIEQQYETELAGSAARVLRITDATGLTLRELAGAEGEPPQDVQLTIDWPLQFAAAQAMSDAYNYAEINWGSRAHSTGGGLVVLDIDTGAVLALASYPTFDPGVFNPDTSYWLVGDYIATLTSDPRQPFINRVIQQQYPPGSVYKIITTAAALAEDLWDEDAIFYCGRTWEGQRFGDTRAVRYDWRNFEPEEANFDTGDVTVSEALAASCNPFFYQMGAQLFTERGPASLTTYAQRMGLGRPTGIDLTPREAAGQIVPPNGVDAAISSAIGQFETQVSIIQMAHLVAGVAHDGQLMQPYIVERVGRAGEPPTYQAAPRSDGDMNLSAAVLDAVREGMCDVTDSNIYGRTSGNRLGTAWFVFSDPEWYPAPYTVCGKTGTAQTGRTEPMGWFVAFAPADDPQIAVAAMIEYGREGSETAAPIVRRVLDAYFGAAEIMPYPEWWTGEYVPLTIPEGSTGV
jgi:penicillin-binding protein 2